MSFVGVSFGPSSCAWDTFYPDAFVSSLVSDVSDHVPIMLCSVKESFKVKRFRFERMWLLEHGFRSTIANCWSFSFFHSDLTSNLVFKTRRVRTECKNWCRVNFYSIRNKKLDLLNCKRNIDSSEEYSLNDI